MTSLATKNLLSNADLVSWVAIHTFLYIVITIFPNIDKILRIYWNIVFNKSNINIEIFACTYL